MPQQRHIPRTKLIAGVLVTAAVAYAAVLGTLFTNKTAATAVNAGFIIALLAVVAYIAMETYFRVLEPKRTVEIIEGETELKRRYEEMRRTEGARSISAIWSAHYPDVEDYFRTESRDLEANSALEVERLVNPDVLRVHTNLLDDLRALASTHPRFKVWGTEINEFECFLCEYVEKGVTNLK